MRSSFFTLCGWPGLRWLLLSTFVLPCLADVRFTAPAAGAILKSGHIEVRWENSGINPPISELTQYTLSLMVGGNKDADMQPISTFESDGSFSDGNSAQGTIPEGIAADVKNGFFFRMTSTKEAGGVLINYSDRFSIPGLSGETALHIRQAAQALNGNTNGPPSVGNDSPAQSSTSAVSSTSTHLTSAISSTSVTTDVPSETPSTTRDSPETSATSTANAGNSSNGLSKGAIAGIAVGATVAIITLCAASVSFFWVRHRRKQQEVQEIVPGKPFHQKPVSELSDEHPLWPKRAWVRHRELSNDSMIHEAGSGERPPELDSMAFRAELEGSSPLSLK